jgi:hypothetical protein
LKKSLEISAKLEMDQSSFDRSIASMQRKLRELYQPSDTMRQQSQIAARLNAAGIGVTGPNSPGAEQAALKYRKDLNGYIKEEYQKQESLVKIMATKNSQLKEMMSFQNSVISGSKEELRLKQSIARLEENQGRRQQVYGIRNERLERAARMKEAIMGMKVSNFGEMGSDFPGAMDKFTAKQGGGSAIGSAVGNLGGIGKALGIAVTLETAKQVVEHLNSLSRQTITATGSATQGLIGQPLQNLLGSGMIEEMAFAPERKKATQTARDETRGIVGELLGRFGTKAGIVSLSPYAMLVTGGKTEAAYQAQQEALVADRATSMFEAEKQKNPEKLIQAQRSMTVQLQNLQTQRMLGLSDKEFYGSGGFAENANRNFTSDMAAKMASEMQAAGGSTRGMKGLTDLGMLSQRGFDLTNAGSVLGKISGGAGGSVQSEQVFRKIMIETIREGLDTSDYREEQRHFAETTAEILSRSGAKTEDQADMILRGFSRFLGKEPTMREMEGAKTAYEQYQAGSAETSGRGGALQFAGAIQAGLGRSGGVGIGDLMERPEDTLDPDDPFIIAVAKKEKLSPQALISKVKKLKRNKAAIEIGISPKHLKYLQDKGITEPLTKKELDDLEERDETAAKYYEEVQIRAGVKDKFISPQDYQARVRGFLRSGFEEGRRPKTIEQRNKEVSDEEFQYYKEKANAPRQADQVIQDLGVQQQMLLTSFKLFNDQLTPSATALQIHTEALLAAAKKIDPTGTQKAIEASKGKSAKNQGQAGAGQGKGS